MERLNRVVRESMKLFCGFIVMGVLLLPANALAGGPWPQKKGKGYFKISEWWILFDEHFTDSGMRDPNVTTGIYNTFVYTEYGLADRLTGIINGALFSRNYMNNLVSLTTKEVLVPGEALNSIGDFELGLKYGLNSGGLPVSVSLYAGLPLGSTDGGTQGNLQTGDGEFNQMIQFDVGSGFLIGGRTSAYMSAYLGFNNRTQGFSEEIRYGLEMGIQLAPEKLWLTGRLYGVESLKNGSTAATTTSTSIFANNTEYSSFSLEANYYVNDRLGLSAGFASAFRGEIIAAAPSYTVGIFYDFSK